LDPRILYNKQNISVSTYPYNKSRVALPITIGIPFYNAEMYLADAIRSVFAQTYQEWELLLIDDGSTDLSLDIALAVRDPRVRVISDGQNKRLPYRLNQITAEAKYDLIGRMDADDLISPKRFEKQLEVISMHPEIDLVTTGMCSLTNDNHPIGTRGGSPKDTITVRKLLLGQWAIVHAAILGRRSWFLRNKYDESINRIEDYELWLRACSKNDFKLYIMNEFLYYYREEENVTPRRLLTAYANQRCLYKQYGCLGLDRWEVALLLAKSRCKSLMIQILSVCNKMDLLLTYRNNPIRDENMVDHFNREIQQIFRTRLPGIDDGKYV
jgi:glycosyltransferase involved in cell wall biosynthesis